MRSLIIALFFVGTFLLGFAANYVLQREKVYAAAGARQYKVEGVKMKGLEDKLNIFAQQGWRVHSITLFIEDGLVILER